MADITAEDLNALGAKLDALDLTDTERELLDVLFQRARDYEPDVAGFALNSYAQLTGFRSGSELIGTGLRLGEGLGVVQRPDLGYGGRTPGAAVGMEDPLKP